MANKFLLDTNIASKICFPKHKDNKDIALWFIKFINNQDHEIYMPEIVSYEVRRGLKYKELKDNSCKHLERFEALSKHLIFLPLNSNVFGIAEELWAKARMSGTPTAGNDSIDADVILAAQALDIHGSVITENTKHLKNYVKIYHWHDL